MKILLDTHMLIWALRDDERLPDRARDIISNLENEILYSIVSPWEVTIKHMSHPETFITTGAEIIDFCEQAGFRLVTVNKNHVIALQSLHRREGVPSHKDPFDRIMIVQAKVEEATFLTHDSLLADYNEPCILKI